MSGAASGSTSSTFAKIAPIPLNEANRRRDSALQRYLRRRCVGQLGFWSLAKPLVAWKSVRSENTIFECELESSPLWSASVVHVHCVLQASAVQRALIAYSLLAANRFSQLLYSHAAYVTKYEQARNKLRDENVFFYNAFF